MVANFTASPVRALAAALVWFFPVRTIALSRCGTFSNVEFVPSESLLSFTEVSGVGHMEKKGTDFTRT